MYLKRIITFLLLSSFFLVTACANHNELLYVSARQEHSSRQVLLDHGIFLISKQQKVIVLIPNDKLFEMGTDNIMPMGKKLLDEIFNYLRQFRYANIHVAGNTDSILAHMKYQGKNLTLLQAKSVVDYLKKKGLTREKAYGTLLTYSGEDADRPIASNSTFSGMKHNRRIQITIYAGRLENADVSSPFKTQYKA